MTWGKTEKYRQPDRRRYNGWQWFTKSKYGPFVVVVIVAIAWGLIFG